MASTIPSVSLSQPATTGLVPARTISDEQTSRPIARPEERLEMFVKPVRGSTPEPARWFPEILFYPLPDDLVGRPRVGVELSRSAPPQGSLSAQR